MNARNNNFINFYALHVVAEMQFDKVPETGKIKSNVQIISMNRNKSL